MKKLSVNRYLLYGNPAILRLAAITFFSILSLFAQASEAASEFAKANGLYQKQNYESAAKIYEQLIAQEYLAPEVYYNLASCYYKLNNTSRAVLNYERALKLRPDDEDAAFNLKVAQLKVVDKIEPVPEIFYRRWIKSISSALSTDGWSRFVIACTWILFFFGAVYVLSRRTAMKRIGFVLAAFFVFVTICAWVLSQQSYADHVSQKRAVIMSVSAYVKSSPGDNNTDLFLLHEGTKVDILDEYENWVKIRIANGSVGWLKSNEMEQI